MKTIEQTNRYLSTCIFDDGEWGKVLEFCRTQYGGGKVHRPRRGQFNTCYADFLVWFNHLPGQGDIVSYNNMVGIIGKCTSSEYFLYAYTGIDGKLIQKELPVHPKHLKPASSEKEAAFRNLMASAMVKYSVKLGMMVKMYTPENGEFVSVRQGNKVRAAIFDCIEGHSYRFHYIDNADGSTEPSSIPFSGCDVERASSKDGFDMLAKFSRMGVMWSARDKRFFPVQQRASKGGKYWYVNDRFCVCQSKDEHTPAHNERYDNGNYFTSYGEALVFIKRLKELREELNKGVDQ